MDLPLDGIYTAAPVQGAPQTDRGRPLPGCHQGGRDGDLVGTVQPDASGEADALDNDGKVSSLGLSTEDLADIWSWNAAVPEASHVPVHELIAQTVAARPEDVAVCAWDGEWTYRDLDTLSSQLAFHLLALGVGRKAVPLCFEKSRWMPVAMLAVMKSGAASVALDPGQPETRLRAALEQISPPIILSSSANSDLSGRLYAGAAVVVVDWSDNALPSYDDSQQQLPAVGPLDPLYVLFTSGTTGTPKGVVVTHGNFSSAIRHQKHLMYSSTSRILDFASYAFDVAWSNLIFALVGGACLCIPSEEERKNDLAASIHRLRITHVDLTPSAVRLLPERTIQSLDALITGGEQLRSQEAQQWSTMTSVQNMYGPSECTPTATMTKMGADTDTGSIGKGVGVCTWIVDDRGELAPIGGVGELLLEGPLIGPGYLDEGKTAAAFVKDPPWLLLGGPGHSGRRGRLYRTGDLVRYSTDGTLTFVGRKDMRVKIKGQLVELAEVENTVRAALPVITNVMVDIVTPFQNPNTLLVAFLESGNGEERSLQELKEATFGLDDRLAMTLPSYMVPSVYVPIPAFPVTVTGKMDRQGLRAMAEQMTHEQLLALSHPQNDRKPPTSSAERQLQTLWSSVLSIDADTIGVSDSFLRIGGDSIGAMNLVAKAREHGLYLTVSDIMRRPRLGDLAKLALPADQFKHHTIRPFSLLGTHAGIDSIREQVASLCSVTTEQIEDVFPCTPLQEGLLALTARRAGDYVASHVLELQGAVNVGLFQKAWAEVVADTPILRTRIVDLPGQGLVQVVLDEQVEWISSDKAQKEESHPSANEEQIPVLGIRLVQFEITDEPGEDGPRLFTWTIHHSLYDGYSIALMLETLEKAYFGELWRPAPAFQEFVRYALSVDRVQASSFWERQLQDLEAPVFPTLSTPDYVPEVRASVTRQVSGLHFPRTDVTASTVVRAAWALVVSHYANSKDVVFGVTLTGRQAAVPGVDRMTGPTIATVPVRVLLDSTATVESTLERMQAQSVEMAAFEQVGLQHIKRINDASELACQFQSLLIVQPKYTKTNVENGRLFRRMADDSGEGDGTVRAFYTYAVTVTCILEAEGVEMRIDFDPNVLEPAQVTRIAAHMEHTLWQLCAAENSRSELSTLGTVSDKDLRDIWSWNATIPEAVDVPVHNLITKVVQTQPNNVAICAWDGNWTYKELDALSTRLAYHLITLGGDGGNQLLPLCFEKSKWTPVAMLAAMKAGAASVALDVSQPQDRLRKIIDQVQPTIILSSSALLHLAGQLAQCRTVEVSGWLLDTPGQVPSCWLRACLPVVNPSSILYCVFTSGTTGTPKGVLITHSNFSASIHYQHKRYGFNSDSRVYDFASYAFDAAWMNVLVTLSCGGCLCIPQEAERIDDLAGSITRLRATHVDLTPSVARLLPTETLKQLHTLIVAGEALQPEDAYRWAGMVNLKNVYGPCECTPTATMAEIEANKMYEGSLIGKGEGVCTWVVDTTNGDSLVPIGGVGELLLEGPLVGPGYLGDAEKTAAAFIENPSWLLRGESRGCPGRRGRLYKTGDLVRYTADGSLMFIGRKDMRVKINGQLVELADIEHHIQRYRHVRQCACLVPQAGVYAKRLVGVFSLHGISAEGGDGSATMRPLTVPGDIPLNSHTGSIRDILDASLPAYMVPAVWIAMKEIPLSRSGKLDRNGLYTWLSAIDVHSYDNSDTEQVQKRSGKQNDVESVLLDACSYVLDMPVARLDCQRSFIGNGGDSISAMRLVPRCRAANIVITVAALLQSKSLASLANTLRVGQETAVSRAECSDKPFALSPIQRWFFAQLNRDQVKMPSCYYNQSFCLRVRRHLSSDRISQAIAKLVDLHSMLRARFWRDENGVWSQRTPSSDVSLHSFRSVQVADVADVESLSAEQHQHIDIEKGPVFSVDLCEQPDGTQYLNLIAHHLVVDLVSWRIILDDLETLLSGGELQPCFSFQAWNELQIKKSTTSKLDPKDYLSTRGVNIDLSFWGFEISTPNTRSDQETRLIEIDSETTTLLLDDANRAFQTEPVDLLLSAVWCAFFAAFPDRQGMTIWNEGHGREPWSSEIDLSRTVGWFTTISPIHVIRRKDPAALARFVKDARKRLPANGWTYFTSRYLAPGDVFKDHGPPVEVEFNYHGQFQELGRDDSLFDRVSLDNVLDEGPGIPAPHLFGIEVLVEDGKTHFTVSWNRHIAHQDRIHEWISGIQPSLTLLCNSLASKKPSKTLCDYPFLNLGYDRLDELHQCLLPHIESINNSKVVDVLPCSPTVTGILLSQTRQPELYKTCETYELAVSGQVLPSITCLATAWQKVIAHQPHLRSVLTSGLDQTAAFHQCILESCRGEVFQFDCQDRASALQQLQTLPPLDCQQLKPPHRLVLCRIGEDNRMLCQIEMSHAVTDATSSSILLQDWVRALDGTLPALDLLTTCREFASAFAAVAPDSLNYWNQKLIGMSPCSFPRLTAGFRPELEDELYSINLEVPDVLFRELQQLARLLSVTLVSIFQAAWALTLASYSGSDSVCFGYLGLGRDLPIAGLDRCVGAHANMMVCRVDDARQTQHRDLVQAIHDQMVQDRTFQHCYLAAIQHELNIAPGKSLFNCSLNCQQADSSAASDEGKEGFSFKSIDGQDPTEYDVAAAVTLGNDHAELGLAARPSFISQKQAERVLSLFLSMITTLSTA